MLSLIILAESDLKVAAELAAAVGVPATLLYILYKEVVSHMRSAKEKANGRPYSITNPAATCNFSVADMKNMFGDAMLKICDSCSKIQLHQERTVALGTDLKEAIRDLSQALNMLHVDLFKRFPQRGGRGNSETND